VSSGSDLHPYEVRHLVSHLAAAERHDDLHRLLASEAETTRNLWFEVHERRGDQAGYLADLDRGWQCAEQATLRALDGARSPRTLRTEMRYALMRSSFSAMAELMPNKLRLALLQAGTWTVDRALDDARALWVPGERVAALVALSPELSPERRAEIASEAAALVRDGRLHSLAEKVAAHLSPSAGRRLIEDARAWAPEEHQPPAVDEEPEPPPPKQLSEALALVGGKLESSDDLLPETQRELRSMAARVASGKLGEGDVALVLRAVQELRHPYPRTQAIDRLVPFLHSAELSDALHCSRLLLDARQLIVELTRLAPLLSPGGRARLRHQLRGLPATADVLIADARLLAAEAEDGPVPDRRKLTVIRRLPISAGDNWQNADRVEVIALLASTLERHQARSVLDEALAAAQEIDQLRFGSPALAAVGLRLPDRRARNAALDLAADAARAELHPGMRALTLVRLADIVSGDRRHELLHEAETLASADSFIAGSPLDEYERELVDFVQTQIAVVRAQTLPATDRLAAIRRGIDAVDTLGRIGVFMSAYAERPAALTSLAKALVGLPPQRAYVALQQMLRPLSARPRQEIAAGLVALAPVLQDLAGSSAADGIVEAFEDVRRWWP
jgi:hypothetical protein